jgi:hypothetical protein
VCLMLRSWVGGRSGMSPRQTHRGAFTSYMEEMVQGELVKCYRFVPSTNGSYFYSVRVLRCHTDRTKKIATENSPSLFLTVSEDGTVRQHDLRRPHQCRSECPEPLFRAPRGVDLYSLSVSTVTPHIFAVAGRTECVSETCPVHANFSAADS